MFSVPANLTVPRLQMLLLRPCRARVLCFKEHFWPTRSQTKESRSCGLPKLCCICNQRFVSVAISKATLCRTRKTVLGQPGPHRRYRVSDARFPRGERCGGIDEMRGLYETLRAGIGKIIIGRKCC